MGGGSYKQSCVKTEVHREKHVSVHRNCVASSLEGFDRRWIGTICWTEACAFNTNGMMLPGHSGVLWKMSPCPGSLGGVKGKRASGMLTRYSHIDRFYSALDLELLTSWAECTSELYWQVLGPLEVLGRKKGEKVTSGHWTGILLHHKVSASLPWNSSVNSTPGVCYFWMFARDYPYNFGGCLLWDCVLTGFFVLCELTWTVFWLLSPETCILVGPQY